MKTPNRISRSFLLSKPIRSLTLLGLLAAVYLPPVSWAQQTSKDTSVSSEIKKQLNASQGLSFPNSVTGFYRGNNFRPIWISSQYSKQTQQAMMLLDCVLQYGLAHKDYHPAELTYDLLRDISEKPASVSLSQKVRYEILLSDALITLMNNMHFGKLNPDLPATKIDTAHLSFNAADTLVAALHRGDIKKTIESAQPKIKTYADLQYRMKLLEGLYQSDCYVTPEADVRKIAINMERLRWAALYGETYIQINIPTYTLTLNLPDTSYLFKVIVGRPESPTPTLQSAIKYFTTAPEWKVPKRIFVKEILPRALKDNRYLENNNFSIYDNAGNFVQPTHAALVKIKQHPGRYYIRQSPGCDNSLGLIVFRFQNVYDIYLHDTPAQKLFEAAERHFSHGCIRVEYAEKLGELLLANDGAKKQIPVMHNAILSYKNRDFRLKNAVPIKITYLTCEMMAGWLLVHPDIYNLDKSLELALYGASESLTTR